MNIAQTRQVLTYLWATHPSAGKLDEDSKTAIIASFFRILFKYDIQDVLAAVDDVCRDSPTFVPSAYEIEARCVRRVDVERFLGDEYRDAERKLEEAEARCRALALEYGDAFRERAALLDNAMPSMMTEEQLERLRERVAPLDAVIAKYYEASAECMQCKKHKDELYNRASWEANDAYDRTQAQLAHNDLCSLGYERLVLEG